MSSKRKVATIAITVAALTVGTVGFASASEHKGKKISIAKSFMNVTGVGGGMQGGMQGGINSADRAAHEALIAKTIGLDFTVIKARLAAGESLGAIAGTKKDALIAVLVAEATKRIDAAVTAGKLTAAEATTTKAGLVAQITAKVSATHVAGFLGGQKGGFGQGGMQGMNGKNGMQGGMQGMNGKNGMQGGKHW